jgi:hypothetical protein
MRTFTFNEINSNISNSFASDRLVALRGYVLPYLETRFRVSRPGKLRQRRPYQGGQQVTLDRITDQRFSRTLLAEEASRVFLFPSIHQLSKPRLDGRSTQTTSLVEHYI